ncbi:hypothetical protein MA16_Dca024826 [Dendrobium catenatum]|uniref:Uncharacterized protein n=1 Tax=Dendrobium catenatum TaxID=906689 RepID=A0A2I0WHY7_9ASPA|nr:hypothetical protein MA16_Dca024826 [Dendrobium catenatum]
MTYYFNCNMMNIGCGGCSIYLLKAGHYDHGSRCTDISAQEISKPILPLIISLQKASRRVGQLVHSAGPPSLPLDNAGLTGLPLHHLSLLRSYIWCHRFMLWTLWCAEGSVHGQADAKEGKVEVLLAFLALVSTQT